MKKPCAFPATHHSTDRTKVYHGESVPTILCGYHASPGWIKTALAGAKKQKNENDKNEHDK